MSEPKTNWLNRPLAIVGMACRLPGAEDLDSFWELLVNSGYAIERMPDSKLNRALYFNPQKGHRGKTYAEVGGFVKEREWNWDILPVDPVEAGDWDECHLNLCEVTAQACLHAGYDPRNLPHKDAGVFVGHSGGSTLGGELSINALAEDYAELMDQIPEFQELLNLKLTKDEFVRRLRTGRRERKSGKPFVDASYAAGLVSRAFDLHGPYLSIDAACASSLVALALGAISLQSGETDLAIIGGASFNKADSLILFSHAQSCSAHSSRPFDQDADGLISSEGYVTVLLKTLERANTDGDQVHAVIRGIGISSDGRGRSLWAPRKEGQYTAIERAYSADVRPDSVQLIEAHATSTQVGDATEVEALSAFYSEHLPPGRKLPIGSVKSNIGHTLETAGLAGLVKSVLAIQNATIPPTINVQGLNDSIPWPEIPLYPANQCEEWEPIEPGLPRRAAVNAFGIGGLNVHLVVDEFKESMSTSTPERNSQTSVSKPSPSAARKNFDEPIVVVGRGLVVPGALNVQQYSQLIADPRCLLIPPISGRMRGSNPWRAVNGYITNFEYDWRTHKVPPKQISQANPLQFMLLDAAQQALQEAAILDSEFDRAHTAVVVGSSFGGDFGNSLFAGLRLPEFRLHLTRMLNEQGLESNQTKTLCDLFEEEFLKLYPAILDETGSFTSSTLASRLTKTFDLMGGAMAIDAGDVSGLSALSAAAGLLRSGTVSHVLCAGATRALDRAALENLWQLGRLSGSDATDSGYHVGEGVVLLILKRESDALRDQDHIFATVHELGIGCNHRSLNRAAVFAQRGAQRKPQHSGKLFLAETARKRQEFAAAFGEKQTSLQNAVTLADSPNMKSTGHLQAAQGLLDIVSISLSSQPENEVDLVAAHGSGGQCIMATVNAGKFVPASSSETQPKSQCLATTSLSDTSSQAKLIKTKNTSFEKSGNSNIFRFEGQTLAELTQRIRGKKAKKQFHPRSIWRTAVVCDESELEAKLDRFVPQIGMPAASQALADQGVFWRESDAANAMQKNQVAWIFPGQGSQYPNMLRELVGANAHAGKLLEQANTILSELQQPTFQTIAWDDADTLGQDVWHTQATLLIANWISSELLREHSFAPDLVSGHSYGEFSAMLCAGCWTLKDALVATWHRCQSIVNHVPHGHEMLSIQSDRLSVASVLEQSGLKLWISHINAPQQTVVGGSHSAIQQLVPQLEEHGIASRVLAVPTAFHTPALSPATQPFRIALESITIRPPQIPLLSNIGNHYAADPKEIRDALADQLVSPLSYVGLVERMVEDGVHLAVEVGPQQVLTRLTRQIAPELKAVSTDSTKRGTVWQLLCAIAQLEVEGVTNQRQNRPQATRTAVMPAKPDSQQSLHFDATIARKTRLRQEAGQGGKHISPAATQQNSPAIPSPPTRSASVANPVHPIKSGSHDHVETQDAEPISESTHASKKQKIASFLIDFVVEHTGYPAEIIELDWDMEADLGIDSIKKAQLFGELRDFFDLESHKSLSLDKFATLNDIIELLTQTPAKGKWLESATTQPNSQSQASNLIASGQKQAVESKNVPAKPNDRFVPQQACASSSSTSSDNSKSSFRSEELTKFLVDFVVEQTGYPPEIVELDSDLEADLGIDSIKKAQLLGEIREMFALQIDRDSAAKASSQPQFATLRDILNVLMKDTNAELPPVPIHETAEIGTTSFVAPASEHLDVQATETGPSDVTSTQHSVEPNSKGVTEVAETELLELASGLVIREDESSRKKLYRAAQLNLNALASRKHESDHSQTEIPSNGHAGWYSQRAEKMQQLSGCLSSHLTAFDRALQAQANWKVVVEEAENSAAAEAVLWLAELNLPNWLGERHASPLLGLDYDSSTELFVPGSVTSLAHVVKNRLLVVAGLSEPNAMSGQDYVKMAESLASITADARIAEASENGSGIQEVIKQVTSEAALKADSHDWFCLICDTESKRLATVASTQGVLLVEKHTFDGLSSDKVRNGIGVERSSGRLIVRTQENPAPYPAKLYGLESQGVAETKTKIASRYELQMIPHPSRSVAGKQPNWFGNAMIVGDNPLAVQLESRLRSSGVQVSRFEGNDDPHYLANEFEKLTEQAVLPHLFLTTPHDFDAQVSLDEDEWEKRRNRGILGNFWLCQKWLTHIIEKEITSDASLVAVTALGGDFGINGAMHSAEGGALAGLLKSMIIESWTQGFRPLTIKILDTTPQQSPAEIVGNIWRELAFPSYDVEVSHKDGIRQVIRAFPKPAATPSKPIQQGGTWVCTGGARGITAFVAEELAKRYKLKLHLVGKSNPPAIDPAWTELDADGLKELKAKVMTEARDAGSNPVKAWESAEKALEIDATLKRLKSLRIEAHYHSCDVADRKQLREVLDHVRKISGPIEGILHGAGIGKDSRFDRKLPEKVEQCLAAKIDGAWALMEATQNDPLKYFVGFGSISGRFGANGHTDYSCANEMLCKQIDWFARQRPDVKSVGFHWHAWGDVGMATKPETRLALEMIDMQFMPAQEGLIHLIQELEGSSTNSEVLITDDRYFRMFYPADTVVSPSNTSGIGTKDPVVSNPALLHRETIPLCGGDEAFSATVDPLKDPFLVEHRLDDRPLLPFVVGTEFLLEAAAHQLQSSNVTLEDIEASGAIRFFTDARAELRVETKRSPNDKIESRLYSDFVSRNGRLVEANRLNFKCLASLDSDSLSAEDANSETRISLPTSDLSTWERATYPPEGSQFYVGWSFQRLRKYKLVGSDAIVGSISAPALIELAGGHREVVGWKIPSAAMDACLFTVGILAWQKVAPGSALPVRIERLQLGRLPAPGEACEVHARLKNSTMGRATFDFTLYGVDNALILNAREYEVAWIGAEQSPAAAQVE